MDDFASLRGEHPLVVYVDLKSPYAYLAIAPTRAMAARAGVPVEWRPFTLDIPSYLGSARLDEQGAVAASQRTPEQWSGVRYAYMDARRYANLTGTTVRGTVKIWDSSLAGIAMLWAKRHGRIDAFLDAAYAPFWRRELDLEDAGVLAAVLRAVGVPTEGWEAFHAGPGRAQHDALNAAAFDAGVFGVPTYLAADEMWFGREHLPRVAWLLAGARGPAPDVANRSFAPGTDPAPQTARPTGGTTAAAGSSSRGVDLGPAPLTVALSISHPICYLALGPALALGEELGIAIDWVPIDVPPLRAPTPPAAGDDRSVRHRRSRAHALARELATYGAAQGLVLREPYRAPDTTAFRLGWLWLRETHAHLLPAFLTASFRAYWNLELDPSDPAAVATRLGAVGADAAAFHAWRARVGAERLAAVADDLRARGVFGAPTYLIDGELFLGRQHLPMIRWMLGGRVGPGPI